MTATIRTVAEGAGPAGEWRTQIGQGIARNMSSDRRTTWSRSGPRPTACAPRSPPNKPWKTIFADTPEAASLLLTDLVSAFRLMHDVKLLPVMGASIDVARPRVAEAWRSGRSQRNLKLNLESAQALTRLWAETVPAAHRTKLDALYAAALKAIDAVPADLGEAAADPMRRAACRSGARRHQGGAARNRRDASGRSRHHIGVQQSRWRLISRSTGAACSMPVSPRSSAARLALSQRRCARGPAVAGCCRFVTAARIDGIDCGALVCRREPCAASRFPRAHTRPC